MSFDGIPFQRRQDLPLKADHLAALTEAADQGGLWWDVATKRWRSVVGNQTFEKAVIARLLLDALLISDGGFARASRFGLEIAKREHELRGRTA